MKNLFIISFFTLSFISFGQNHEVSLNYRIGLATNQNQIINPGSKNHLAYQLAETRYDHGIKFNYGYNIWKKMNLLVSGGIELSNSKHYLRVTSYTSGYHLANIEMEMKRFTYHLGLNKQFKFFDDKFILDMGVHIVDRQYFSKSKTYSQENTVSHLDWLQYSYELETTHGEYSKNPNGIRNKSYMYLNLDYNLDMKISIAENLYFNFGLNYSRNNIFFYNYNYRVMEFVDGSDTPSVVYTKYGIQKPSKQGIRDHFIYLTTGLSYKFN